MRIKIKILSAAMMVAMNINIAAAEGAETVIGGEIETNVTTNGAISALNGMGGNATVDIGGAIGKVNVQGKATSNLALNGAVSALNGMDGCAAVSIGTIRSNSNCQGGGGGGGILGSIGSALGGLF